MYTLFYRELLTEQTDPSTGFEIDPDTNLLIDPDTGLLYDPTSGHYFDKQSMQMVDPATGEFLDPDTGEPLPPPQELPPDQQLPPEEDPIAQNGDPTQVDPSQADPTQSAEQMVNAQQDQIKVQLSQNVEKYILFQKLSNLKYSLEHLPHTVNRGPEFNDLLYHLTILLTFFDTFEYDQIVQISDFIISAFDEIITAQSPQEIIQ